LIWPDIKKREWDVSLIDSSQGAEPEVREEGPLIWHGIKKREWDVLSLIDSSEGAESEVREKGPLKSPLWDVSLIDS
jgi:hypothetical protein